MKKIFLLTSAVLLAGWTHGGGAVQFNLTDYGANCNGVGEDGPALAAAQVAMEGTPAVMAGAMAVLNFPAGQSCIWNNCPGFSGTFNDIPHITINFNGASLSTTNGCIFFGGQSYFTNVGNTKYQLFQTNVVGATCVTMVTPGTESNFPPGSWVMITGIGLQVDSFPPNFGIWERYQVQSNTGGQVCFMNALKNVYKSTWPGFSLDGVHCDNVTCGGPATIVAMHPNWAGSLTLNNGTINTGGSEWLASKQFTTLNNITTHGTGNCTAPGSADLYIFNNSSTDCQIEIDKNLDSLVFNGGSYRTMQFQSGSVHKVTYNNSTALTLSGTPQQTICNNSNVGSISLGPQFFGITLDNSFIGTNCVFTDVNIPRPGGSYDPYSTGFSLSSSVITATNSISTGLPVQQAVPGGKYMLSGGQFIFSPTWGYTITDMGQTGGFGFNPMTMTTTLPASGFTVGPNGFPSFTPSFGGLAALLDTSRIWSCTNCSGSIQAIDLSQAGAQGVPLYTYSRLTYTCTANLPNVPNSIDLNLNGGPSGDGSYGPLILGTLGTLTYNVTTADTGPNSTVNFLLAKFNNQQILNSQTLVNLGETIDLKHTGTRTITSSTTTGAVGNDSLTAFTGAMTQVMAPWTSADLRTQPAGQCPVVTVTWQTNR